MDDIAALLGRWELAARDVRERMYRAPTPRERERWHALWLLAQGWSANRLYQESDVSWQVRPRSGSVAALAVA